MNSRRSNIVMLTVAVLPLQAGCGADRPLAPGPSEALLASRGGNAVTTPSNLVSIAASPNQIDIAWQDNSSNETGYEVHRSIAGPSGTFSPMATTGPNSTGYVDGGLTASTQYCYKVREFRATGKTTSYSEFSAIACATTPAEPPPPLPATPSSADAWPAASNWVWVNWADNSMNEDGFRIEESLDGGVTWTIAVVIGADEDDAFLPAASETATCYRVIAFNRGEASPPSNTDCATPPAGPSDLTATGIDELTVDLTWTDNSAVESGYEVWACYTGDYGCWYKIATLPANSQNYRSTDGWALGYTVVATNDGGFSDWSNQASATPPPAGVVNSLARTTSGATRRP
jgi:hypothetical protein